MDQEHWRLAADLRGERLDVDVFRHHQHPRITDDTRRWDREAHADMERHHGALAEADKRQCRWRKIATVQLGVEEPLEDRRGFVHAAPALVRIAECQRKPFAAHWGLSAG